VLCRTIVFRRTKMSQKTSSTTKGNIKGYKNYTSK